MILDYKEELKFAESTLPFFGQAHVFTRDQLSTAQSGLLPTGPANPLFDLGIMPGKHSCNLAYQVDWTPPVFERSFADPQTGLGALNAALRRQEHLPGMSEDRGIIYPYQDAWPWVGSTSLRSEDVPRSTNPPPSPEERWGATPLFSKTEPSIFANTLDLLAGIGLSSQDKDWRMVGLALSLVPPVSPVNLAGILVDYTRLPGLDLLDPAFGLIGSAQSCGMQRLPLVSYHPTFGLMATHSRREQASDYNPYRDRHLVELPIRIKQPLWRSILSVASVLVGAGVAVLTPFTGGIFAGARLSEDLAGFVRVKVPRGTQLKPVMTREELAYTLAWINYA